MILGIILLPLYYYFSWITYNRCIIWNILQNDCIRTDLHIISNSNFS